MSTPETLKQMEQAKIKSEKTRARLEKQRKEIGFSAYPAGNWNYGGRYQQASYLDDTWMYSGDYMGSTYGDYRTPANIDFTDDRVLGRSFTSFEQRKKNANRNTSQSQKSAAAGQKKEAEPVTVQDMPDSVESEEFDLDADQVVCFNGRQHWLSTFYESPMKIEDHFYPTVEHYYQACKLFTLGGARLAVQVSRIADAGSVKMTSKRLLDAQRVPKDRVDQWKQTQGLAILKHGIMNKFVQNADLRRKLLDTGCKLLAHTYEMDKMFAVGCKREKLMEWLKEHEGESLKIPEEITADTVAYVPLTGEGKNLLGIINMKIRDQLRRFEAKSHKEIESDPVLATAMASLNLMGAKSNSKDGMGKKDKEGQSSSPDPNSSSSSPTVNPSNISDK